MRAAGLAVALTLALPGAASAATAYVDAEGTAANGCTTPANPCQTIAQGIAVAGAAGEIVVDDGESFSEQVTLASGQLLRVQEFDGVPSGGRSFLDGGAGPAVTITAPNGRVQSFHLTGDTRAVDVQATNATLTDNVFDEGADAAAGVFSGAGADGLILNRNIFLDGSDHTDATTGVVLNADASLFSNDFDDLNSGVMVTAPATVGMIQNSFVGMREDPGGRAGVGVTVETGGVALTGLANFFNDAGAGVTAGILLAQPGAAPVTADLRSSFITGHDIGLRAVDTASVSLESVVLAGNAVAGLRATDTADGAGGDVTGTNLTLWNNGVDIDSEDIALTLDSSIVQSPVVTTAGSSCAITFSRGPTTGSGCANFQTTADPQLAGLDDFGDFNYGLLATSPMIDAGNPAPPAPGAVDFHGEPRAIDGPPQCFTGVARRDIGADEFVPTLCDGPNVPVNPSPETSITSGPKAKVRTRKARVRARFTFVSNEPGSRFLCSLNGGAFAPCQSPATLTVRARRRAKTHELRVRAIDAAGKGDPTPAEYTWKVKRVRR